MSHRNAHQAQTANGVSFTIGKRVPLVGVFAGYAARGSSDSVAELVSVSIGPSALDFNSV
jgi:ABC-type transporter Mla maintaining outer membrane lipid asymmetry permease subunit MlaE